MIVDLFCGCGGLSLGAHIAGFDKVLAIDKDVDLSSSYLKNFPTATLQNADLSVCEPSQFANDIGSVRPTGIIGGPPCQGFSSMGKREESDERNDLLHTYFEFVSHYRPLFFLMENVPGLVAENNKKHLDDALEKVPSIYNVMTPTILDAADYGAATSRPRLVVIGYDPSYVDTITNDDINAAQSSYKPNVRHAISDLPDLLSHNQSDEWLAYPTTEYVSRYARRMRKAPPRGLGNSFVRDKHKLGLVSGFQITRHSNDVIERFSKLPNGSRDQISKYPKLSWEKPAFVLRAGTGSDRGSFQAARPIHPDHPRVISVREAARIQGFPDWFVFHKTKWHSHRMIGNSVSPPFAESLIQTIVSKLKTVEQAIAAE